MAARTIPPLPPVAPQAHAAAPLPTLRPPSLAAPPPAFIAPLAAPLPAFFHPAPVVISRIAGPRSAPTSAFHTKVLDAQFSAELHEGNSMPTDFRDQLLELEEWAQANKRDAVRDSIGFWALKIPAILASASAGVWANFDLVTASVLAGAVASLCVIVDGIHPRGMLRNTHLRAYHDIRILIAGMVADWRSRNASAKDDNTARRIIREAESERQRIAASIRDAETALIYKNET